MSRYPTGSFYIKKLPVYHENENNSVDIEGPESGANGRLIHCDLKNWREDASAGSSLTT